MTQATTTVRRAEASDVPALAALFDGYRRFYKQPSDSEAAGAFIGARLEHGESVVFLAERGDDAIGFTQLYPMFSSVQMRRTWILNDLFVDPAARRSGAGCALMEAAIAFAQTDGAASIALETAGENLPARSLYEALGFRTDRSLIWYTKPLAQLDPD